MLDSPLPEVEGVYELDEVGGQYRLSYNDGPASVVTMMTKDFAITELKISTSDIITTISPQLLKTPQGFVLTGLVADAKPTVGPGTVSKWQVDYHDVEGFQLPNRLRVSGVRDG